MGCDISGVVQPLLIAVEENETVLDDTPEKLQLNNVVLFHPGTNTIVQLPSTDVMSLYSETNFCYIVPSLEGILCLLAILSIWLLQIVCMRVIGVLGTSLKDFILILLNTLNEDHHGKAAYMKLLSWSLCWSHVGLKMFIVGWTATGGKLLGSTWGDNCP
jgi:hypothetical protein